MRKVASFKVWLVSLHVPGSGVPVACYSYRPHAEQHVERLTNEASERGEYAWGALQQIDLVCHDGANALMDAVRRRG